MDNSTQPLGKPADTGRAFRAVENAEKIAAQGEEIRWLQIRGLISDQVAVIASVAANRAHSGPEEERLKQDISACVKTYVEAIRTPSKAFDYLDPIAREQKVTAQSLGLKELQRLEAEAATDKLSKAAG